MKKQLTLAVGLALISSSTFCTFSEAQLKAQREIGKSAPQRSEVSLQKRALQGVSIFATIVAGKTLCNLLSNKNVDYNTAFHFFIDNAINEAVPVGITFGSSTDFVRNHAQNIPVLNKFYTDDYVEETGRSIVIYAFTSLLYNKLLHYKQSS